MIITRKFLENRGWIKKAEVERYGFIPKERIKDVIEDARQSERTKAEREKKEMLDQLRTDLEEAHLIDRAHYEAEISMQNKNIDQLKEEIKKAQEAYRLFRAQTKQNIRISESLEIQVRRIFDKSGDIYQAIMEIKDQAAESENEMIRIDVACSGLLQMKPLEVRESTDNIRKYPNQKIK